MIAGIVVLSVIVVISIVVILALRAKIKTKDQQIEQAKTDRWQSISTDLAATQQTIESLLAQEKALNQQIKYKEQQINDMTRRYQDEMSRMAQNTTKAAEAQNSVIEQAVKLHYEDQMATYAHQLASAMEDMRLAAEYDYQEMINPLLKDIVAAKQQLQEYQEKLNAVNQEILRQRAINEQQDFYRICLTDIDLQDIAILHEIKPKLGRGAYLDKLIYDNYVSKYVKEMVKRVLAGQEPSGIYKVTNILTQEKYIGKSTNISDRWVNHVKSACGLEGVADSQFQRALKKYGIENFTWEVLEEVPKDKLTEREKFFISFYETNKYGYNMKVG